MKSKHSSPSIGTTPSNLTDGRVLLNTKFLKKNRKQLGLSQMGLAEYAQSIRQPISIASIKRAELGRPLIYRTAQQLAKIFKEDVSRIIINDANDSMDILPPNQNIQTNPNYNFLIQNKEKSNLEIRRILTAAKANNNGLLIYITGDTSSEKSLILNDIINTIKISNSKVFKFDFSNDSITNDVLIISRMVFMCLGFSTENKELLNESHIKTSLVDLGLPVDFYNDIHHAFVGNGFISISIFDSTAHESRIISLKHVLFEVIKAYCKKQYLLVILNDIHWGNLGLLHILKEIAIETHGLPITWVMTSNTNKDTLIRGDLIFPEKSINLIKITL